MKKRIPNALLFIFIIIKSNHCLAWGKQGHELVAEIAKAMVNKPVLDSVNKYLDAMTWEKAAVWMDDMRSDHEYDYMKPMHYMNIEKDKTYVKTDQVNIINEIELVISELKKHNKLPRETINKNLKMLFHLIGDIHMPLHVGYGEDKGGNSVTVDFFGKSTNLHRVWDTEIIERNKKTQDEIKELFKGLSKAEISKREKTDIISWINEGRALLPSVYGFQNEEITDDYINKNTPVIENQILNAGIRLAGILNEVFQK